MHRITFLIFSFISSTLIAQNNMYIVDGKVTDNEYNGKKIYLQQLNDTRNGFINIDSTTIDNSSFVFNRTLQEGEPTLKFINIEESRNQRAVFFIAEAGNIHITVGSPNKVGGTLNNDLFQEFSDNQELLNNELQEIVNKYSQLNQTSDNQAKMMDEGQSIIKQIQQKRYEFAKTNINNDLGEFIALSSFEVFSPTQVLELVSLMKPEFQESDLGKQVTAYYEGESAKSVGGTYKDITLKDPQGKNISISDYVGKNKVVLIDFWASWCGPCIKEMPNVVEAYRLYKDKGFEIIGISMDEEQGRWLSTIDRLNMTWVHMSDLKGWKSAAAQLYGINSIPYTLLVDKNGKIIDTNLRGNQLLTKLKELLD